MSFKSIPWRKQTINKVFSHWSVQYLFGNGQMSLVESYFHMSFKILSAKIKTLDNGWKVEMCKIPKEASLKCFICLSDEEIEVCKSCDVGMCYRHKAVHKNSDGQCYPFKVDIRGDLGKSLGVHYILRIINDGFQGGFSLPQGTSRRENWSSRSARPWWVPTLAQGPSVSRASRHLIRVTCTRVPGTDDRENVMQIQCCHELIELF